MTREEIANKIEADARQFYKRYTAGLEILDDDLRMLTGFGLHLHNTAADQSRVIEVMQTALEHYANPENWGGEQLDGQTYGNVFYPDTFRGHEIAAKALAEYRGEK